MLKEHPPQACSKYQLHSCKHLPTNGVLGPKIIPSNSETATRGNNKF